MFELVYVFLYCTTFLRSVPPLNKAAPELVLAKSSFSLKRIDFRGHDLFHPLKFSAKSILDWTACIIFT